MAYSKIAHAYYGGRKSGCTQDSRLAALCIVSIASSIFQLYTCMHVRDTSESVHNLKSMSA